MDQRLAEFIVKQTGSGDAAQVTASVNQLESEFGLDAEAELRKAAESIIPRIMLSGGSKKNAKE